MESFSRFEIAQKFTSDTVGVPKLLNDVNSTAKQGCGSAANASGECDGESNRSCGGWNFPLRQRSHKLPSLLTKMGRL